MASNDPTREELLEEVARLRAENERLQAMLGQDNSNETAQETQERQETQHGEQQDHQQRQLVPRQGNGERTDVELGFHHQQAREDQEQVPDDQEQVAVISVDNILLLPIDLLGRALDFLPFDERRAFFVCGSRDLWEIIRVEYESSHIHLLSPPAPPPIIDMLNLTNLHTLDLGTHCSDTVLRDMRHPAVLPNLKHLSMVGALSVTDRGLGYLVQNPVRCRTLLSLDILFCPYTTIEVTFLLRNRIINLHFVRRQPEWMDGEIHHQDGTRTVYWADGSSAFYDSNGKMSYCIYFRNLFEEGSRHRVVAKEQVVSAPFFESESFQSQPEWFRHSFCPGVRFLHLPDTQSTVMAGRAARNGSYPVQGLPRPEFADLIPLNFTCHFNRQEEPCQPNDPQRYAFVGHLQLQQLDSLMPPQDVVNRIRDQVAGSKVVMAGRNQENDERDVHVHLGGNRNDVPPDYWFQY